MNLEGTLQEFISDRVLGNPAESVGVDDPLISSGRVDSMGLLQILGFVRERFGVDLLATSQPRDFETVRALASAIRKARGPS